MRNEFVVVRLCTLITPVAVSMYIYIIATYKIISLYLYVHREKWLLSIQVCSLLERKTYFGIKAVVVDNVFENFLCMAKEKL